MKNSYVIEKKSITIEQLVNKYGSMLSLIGLILIGLAINKYNLNSLEFKSKSNFCKNNVECEQILQFTLNKFLFYNLVIKYCLIISTIMLVSYNWIKKLVGPYVQIELILFWIYWTTCLLDYKNIVMYKFIIDTNWDRDIHQKYMNSTLDDDSIDLQLLMYFFVEMMIFVLVIILVLIICICFVCEIFVCIGKYYQRVKNVKIEYNICKEIQIDKIV